MCASIYSKHGCIGVLPFGKIPEHVLKEIGLKIESHFFYPIKILSAFPNPEYAHDNIRDQYNAAVILQTLESIRFEYCDKVIGVLNSDLFIPVFTHVLGEAREGGNCALVSMYRLIKHDEKSSATEKMILTRISKIALHEIGHLFNISHCMNEKCIMHFSSSLQDIDKIGPSFCIYCKSYLDKAIKSNRRVMSALPKKIL